MIKRLLASFAALMALAIAGAQAPAGYYTRCEGKSGQQLLTTLADVVGPHTTISYDGLWEVYNTSDVRDDGTVWDIYSTKAWVVGKERCGNYKNVGDCINREHAFPKSWFDKGSPMVSDAFHIYPTDGKVNGQRSNFPYGECAGGSSVGANGSIKPLGKLGNCTFAGYTGTVFEPDDEYKGDLARSYFYMAACYNSRIQSWSSPMLAGNSYPAFTPWALNLLLKWHRQDPVSEKEIKRNNAVYAYQKNRNPFIDHPDLVEHIWGTRSTTAWTHDEPAPEPYLISPADGSTINVGTTAVGITRSITVPVKGRDITGTLSLSVSGEGFSISQTAIDAATVNAGRSGIYVRYLSNRAATSTGILLIKGEGIDVRANLTAAAIDGLPVMEATDITETSFTANWCNIDEDGTNYLLDVKTAGASIAGYPRYVPAEDENYTVTSLQPGVTYTYTLSNASTTSQAMTVTTAAPIQSIQFMYDGELNFTAAPGEPSEIAELLLDIDNIDGNITIAVDEPFQVSMDKSTWTGTITMVPGEDRFYLRMLGDKEGSYTTEITATAGNYVNDDAEATGTIGHNIPTFIETFENQGTGSYTAGSYNGTACLWNTNDAGWWDSDHGCDSDHALRLGKSSASSLTTSVPKAGGLGTVTLDARRWSASDGNVVMEIEYSPDGTDWKSAGSVTVSNDNYMSYSRTVNAPGAQYLRLRQTQGARGLIDNISVTDYSGVGAVATLEYHSWDAMCRGGQLVIENHTDGAPFTVYGTDGRLYLDTTLAAGETAYNLPPALYLVSSNGFTRRVVVR